MSDETRTVTVAGIEAAMRTARPSMDSDHLRVGCDHGMSAHSRRGCHDCSCLTPGFGITELRRDAEDLFAALPVATAGPEPDGEKAILDRVRRLAERADPDHVDAVVSFTRQNLAALRGAAAQADGGEAGRQAETAHDWRDHSTRPHHHPNPNDPDELVWDRADPNP